MNPRPMIAAGHVDPVSLLKILLRNPYFLWFFFENATVNIIRFLTVKKGKMAEKRDV